MTFSAEWEGVYEKNTHLSVWPWSDLVSYVMRYAKPKKEGVKVLEVGFGAAANIPFFKRLKADYYGLEGSSIMVEQLKKEYPEYAPHLLCCDFTKEIPFEEKFDIIVDRAAITHNDTVAIKRTLDAIWEKLKDDGKFIGIDWFSKAHSDYTSCEASIVDDFTKTNFLNGQFVGVGNVHFSDEAHILELFEKFNIDKLEHKHNDYLIPNGGEMFASFNLVATKKA